MPYAYITLEEVDQSILRPVVVDIVEQIKEQTSIPKSVPIYFPGDIGVVAPVGTEVGSTDKENTALFAAQKAIRIEVEQDYDLDEVLSTNMDNDAATAFFIDPQTQIVAMPIYITSIVTIHFKYTTHSKAEAFRWRENMRMRASMQGDINLHNIHYHYVIPIPLLVLLKRTHELREEMVPTGEGYQAYLERCMSTKLALVTDEAQKDKRLVMRESQTRIQGLYEFNYIPEKPSRDDSTGMWTIEFSYNFEYERPATVRVVYPIMVYQQLLDMKFVEHLIDKKLDYTHQDLHSPGYRAATRYFESPSLYGQANTSLIHVPEFDTFIPTQKLAHWSPLITFTVSITPDDKTTLFNLKDLGDIELDTAVITMLEAGGYSRLCHPYKTLYTACIYEFNTLMPVGVLQCDSNLNLTSSIDLDLTKIYRVVLGVNTHVGMVDPAAIEGVVDTPDVVSTYIASAYSNVQTVLNISPTSTIPVKSKSDLNLLYWLMTGNTLFFDTKDLSDNVASIADFIINRTRICPELQAMVINGAANLMCKNVNQLIETYGEMNPVYLLTLRNQLTVIPRVLRTGVIAITNKT